MSLLAIAAGTAALAVELEGEAAELEEESGRRLDPGQIESLQIAHADLLDALRRLTDVLGLPAERLLERARAARVRVAGGG